MTRTVKVLPVEITEIVYGLGSRKAVAVEGPSDVEVLEEWYADRLSEVYFYVAGGHTAVADIVKSALALGSAKRVFGIIDRDSRDDAEVEAPLADAHAHLFILRRYCMENYLLEPQAVHEVARTFLGKKAAPGVQTIHDEMYRICRSLQPMMAANWVLLDNSCELYAEAHDVVGREQTIDKIVINLQCTKQHAKTLIASNEEKIESALTRLDSAHSRISGKHLLYNVLLFIMKHKKKKETGLHRDVFRRWLAKEVLVTTGVHDDIKAIVEGRVLNRAV